MVNIPTSVFGLLSLIITTLATVVGLLWRQNTSLYRRIDDLQNQRVSDAQETRDKIAVPLQQIAQYSEATYNKIINSQNGK